MTDAHRILPLRPTAPREPVDGRRDGFAIAFVALLCYLTFHQTTIYQADGYQFCVWVTSGQITHPVHYAFLPLLHLWKNVAGWFGVPFYTAGCALGACGTALGLWFVHASCSTLALPRRDAAIATCLVACAPGVFFFATVLEVHGAFFAAAGLAFFLGCRMVTTQTTHWSGVWFGLATGLSFTLHASAVVLPFTFGLWILAESVARRTDVRATIVRLSVAAILHAACVSAALTLIPLWLGINEKNAVDAWDRFDWGDLGSTLVPTVSFEWIYAFAPISLWYLIGFAQRTQRLQAIALTVALLPYLAVALKIIPAANEHGAYLLPMAIPAAIITTRSLRAVWPGVVLALFGLGVSIAFVLEHDDPAPSRALAADIAAATGDAPVNLFVADRHGMEACMSFLSDARMIWVGDVLRAPPEVIDIAVPIWVETADAEDRVLLLPRSVERDFLGHQAAALPTAGHLLAALQAHARWEHVEHGNFAGTVLRPPNADRSPR